MIHNQPPLLRHGLRSAAPVLLAASLLACCPVPSGQSVETSFAAVLASVAPGEASALLDSGRRVLLLYGENQPSERLAAGQRVYVEGLLAGQVVQVSRITVIPQGARAQPVRAATAAAPMTPAAVPSMAGRNSGTG
jgi:hypothetical protein